MTIPIFKNGLHHNIVSCAYERYFNLIDKLEKEFSKNESISNKKLSEFIIHNSSKDCLISEFNSLSMQEKLEYLTSYVFTDKDYKI
jgi:hypothetical protein